MKKIIALLLAACMMFAAALAEPTIEGRQVATAWLDQDGVEINAIIELNGGWSVEFARGAFYLYDGDYSEDKEAVAYGLTLDKEVFDEYIAEAEVSETRREIEDVVYYEWEDGSASYLVRVGKDAYFMLRVNPGVDGDAVFARLTLNRYSDAE